MEGEKVDTAGPCVQKTGTLSYLDMVLGTLMSMEDTRTGVSRQKIVSYMRYLYPVKSNGMRFTKLLSNALNKGVEEGVLVQTAGARGSGSFRLSKNFKKSKLYKSFQQKENSVENPGRGIDSKKFYHKRTRQRKSTWESHQSCTDGLNSRPRRNGQKTVNYSELYVDFVDYEEDSDYEEDDDNESEDDCHQTRKSAKVLRVDVDDKSAVQMSEYERKRMQNIEANKAIMAELQLMEAVEGVKEKVAVKKRKVTQSQPRTFEPVRRSLRVIQKTSPSFVDTSVCSSPCDPQLEDFSTSPPLRPSGTFPMSCQENVTDEEEKYLEAFSRCVGGSTSFDAPTKPLSADLEALSKLETSVFKVTPKRISSIDAHPHSGMVLVAVGDTIGTLGLLDVTGGSVFTYSPHIKGINKVRFPTDPSSTKLFTSSYDGSLRCADLNSRVFDEVYSLSDNGCYFTTFDLQPSLSYALVGRENGSVELVDLREQKGPSASWFLHCDVVKCVHISPADNNQFVSTSRDCFVKVWDMRNVTSSIKTVKFHRSVSSAYFSPLSGSKILATSWDDTIRVFSCEQDDPYHASIHHFNQTGRWLTPFKAEWDPKSDDCFIVGSLDQPRKVEIYRLNSDTLHYEVAYKLLDSINLTAISSINTYHTSLPVIFGANSSGRVIVWN